MIRQRALIWLCGLVGVLALVATGVGLLAGGNAGPSTFTSVHGEDVRLYGEGLYRLDSLIDGSGSRGVDAVTLLLGIPLLAGALWAHRRGSLRGNLLLAGILAWFLYLYASRALDTIYNELFGVYVVLFSASAFALALALGSVRLGRSDVAGLPRRSVAAGLIVIAGVLVLIWVPPIVAPMLDGRPSEVIEHYTTFVTGTLDLGILLPLSLLAAALVLRREPLGYLIAVPILALPAMLGPALSAMTIAQLQAGVDLTVADAIRFVASFLVLSAIATVVLVRLLLRLPPASRSVEGPSETRRLGA